MEAGKGKSFSFQWYPKDILSSERVALMDLKEEGAYRRALDFCWLRGSIPADLKQLSKLIGKGCNVKIAGVVAKMFRHDCNDPERLVHERLQKEKAKQDEWREKSSAAGKKSAAMRIKKGDNGPEIVNGKLNQFPTNVQPTLENGNNQNATLPFPLSPFPISPPTGHEEKNENIIIGPSELFIQAFPQRYMLIAKNHGVPHEEIPNELEKFDEYHVETHYENAAHAIAGWGIWCSKYRQKKEKPKSENGFKKQQQQETGSKKPKFNGAKGPEYYF